jgi:Na+/H+-dicarboxylate symporter
MFRKMPFILVAVILAVICLDSFIPMFIKSILLSISLSIKAVIIFLLPLIIFSLLFKASVKLAHNASKVILLILIMVCTSNLFSTLISYLVGSWIYGFDLLIQLPNDIVELAPLWSLQLPKIIANDKAMFLGLGLGIISSFIIPDTAEKIADCFDKVVAKVLSVITFIIPFFVAGFVVKLQAEGVMETIMFEYSLIFIIIALAQFSYVTLIYFLANQFNLKRLQNSIKNMLPAAIAGFSTMSSAAAMPLTIIAAQKNTRNPDLAQSVIPATVNIHLVGDCFAIPIVAFAILKNYGVAEPAFIDYFIFAFYFVLAKFSVAAIPGGGILVMLPILESYLGFNAEMMSLITAIYILFDPVITCVNVLGNGAFALIIDKIVKPFKPKHR